MLPCCPGSSSGQSQGSLFDVCMCCSGALARIWSALGVSSKASIEVVLNRSSSGEEYIGICEQFRLNGGDMAGKSPGGVMAWESRGGVVS